MPRSRFSIAILAMAASFAVNTALAQEDSSVAQGRQEVQKMAQQELASLYDASPGTRSAIEHAAGYGVFSTVGVKLLFAGGTRGKGVVVNSHTHGETFMKMLQVRPVSISTSSPMRALRRP